MVTLVKRKEEKRFFYGWVIVIAASLIMLMCGGIQFSYGVFFKPLLEEFGWTRSATSSIFTLYMLTRGFFNLITGLVSDRFGSRFIITIGGVCMGLGLFLTSLANSFWHFCVFYSMTVGMGIGSVNTPLVSTLSRWFKRRRGLVLGIYFSNVGVGTLVFAPLAEMLISAYSWRTSYVILALMVWLIIIISAPIMRNEPADVGLLPDGEIPLACLPQEFSSPKNTIRECHSLRETLHMGAFWVLLAINIFSVFSVFGPMVHLVAYLTDAGILPMDAAKVLGVIGVSGVMGRLAMGIIADKTNPVNLLMGTLLIQGVTLFSLIEPKGLITLYIFGILFGFSWGGSVPLLAVLIGEYFGVGSIGAVFGTIQFVSLVAGSFSPIVAGYAYDVVRSYRPIFVMCGILSVLAVGLSVCLKTVKRDRG
jgi:OFA family oxalate/formate antiporter-like MFS transporter